MLWNDPKRVIHTRHPNNTSEADEWLNIHLNCAVGLISRSCSDLRLLEYSSRGGGVKLNSRGLDQQGLRLWLTHFCFLHLRNIAKKQTFSVIPSSGTFPSAWLLQFTCITPTPASLHWLPVKFRIHFKILLLKIKLYTDRPLRPYHCRRSLPSNQGLLTVPRSDFKTTHDHWGCCLLSQFLSLPFIKYLLVSVHVVIQFSF